MNPQIKFSEQRFCYFPENNESPYLGSQSLVKIEIQMQLKARVEALRDWMSQRRIDAYIIPSGDPHKSEYVADHWKVREWISGFTGSAGTVIVTASHLGLWTDSRYFLQADTELKASGGTLHRLVNQGASEYVDWLREHLSADAVVGIDGLLFSAAEVESMERALGQSGIRLETGYDPFPDIWTGRPALPAEAIFEHATLYAGYGRDEKIARVREQMFQKHTQALLITALDEIAWLLNLRGRDVACNPVFIAYAVVETEKVKLFVHRQKIASDLQDKLSEAGIELLPYTIISDYLAQLNPDKRIWIDRQKTSFGLMQHLMPEQILHATSPVTLLKASKNATEQKYIRQVMVKDGVALLRAYRWLEARLDEGAVVREADFARQIAHCRSLQPGYFGESFDAIIGYEGNGAIVHYRPDDEKSAEIRKGGMLLVDSGGQYQDGTTDITRTHHLGTPSDEQRRNFTLVLKGHIALANIVFPSGTTGVQLDILARQYLWGNLLNYGHGTGHGVGFFMNVHEPPQGFVPGLGERGVTVHQPGMLSSNEPGFYKSGQYGIRIENLVLCRELATSDFGPFYHFETVTLFPIDQNLIDTSLMLPEEMAWLDQYHQRVLEALSPHLEQDEQGWLSARCAPLTGAE